MITVEGGFAKAVNVVSTIEGDIVKTLVYMKMTYADNNAKIKLTNELRKYGYKYECGNTGDDRFKVIYSKLLEVSE